MSQAAAFWPDLDRALAKAHLLKLCFRQSYHLRDSILKFEAACNPILIGSLPLTDHRLAMAMICKHCPELPLWPQLPKNPKEGMVRQFLDGFPGLIDQGDGFFIESKREDYPLLMADFYEDYFAALEVPSTLFTSRFALLCETAQGFWALDESLAALDKSLAVKGQITGPITTGIGCRTDKGDPILYSDGLRDMLVKHLGLKGLWQVKKMQKRRPDLQPIIFIDEPGMVSFGSTGFAGVTQEMVKDSVNEVIDLIKTEDALVGIHICANGDWGPSLLSQADIISFDAYCYFENLILYRNQLAKFLRRGGILAWGIIPTGDPQAVARENSQSLFARWQKQLEALADIGISRGQLMRQTLIAPSCGTGSLSLEAAEKVLAMTAEVARLARKELGQAQH